jgi:hypothetical protein
MFWSVINVLKPKSDFSDGPLKGGDYNFSNPWRGSKVERVERSVGGAVRRRVLKRASEDG